MLGKICTILILPGQRKRKNLVIHILRGIYALDRADLIYFVRVRDLSSPNDLDCEIVIYPSDVWNLVLAIVFRARKKSLTFTEHFFVRTVVQDVQIEKIFCRRSPWMPLSETF